MNLIIILKTQGDLQHKRQQGDSCQIQFSKQMVCVLQQR